MNFGCDTLGKLESVMVHSPGPEIELINNRNYRDWLFDSPPDTARFREEHARYVGLLKSSGIKVHELGDFLDEKDRAALARMPNATYLHDIAVVSCRGAVLSSMAFPGRSVEHLMVKKALLNMGIPIAYEAEKPFEGCLLLSPNSLFVAETERHSSRSVLQFIRWARQNGYDEIIHADIPKERRFMHPDTVLNRITPNLALAYLPALNRCYVWNSKKVYPVHFVKYMESKGIEIIGVTDEEQKRLACSFVPVESGTLLHYDTALSPVTVKQLKDRGIRLVLFHPDALIAGGGSLRCITLRLCRR